MQRLNLAPDAEWIDLPRGVRVKVAPITTGMIFAARRDPALAEVLPSEDQELIALVMGQSIARIAITEWDGVGDADGNPIDPTPEAITELMNIWPICKAFMRRCVDPVFDAEAEKKDCAPSPSGSSEGARDTATHAGRTAPTAHGS